MKIGSLGVPAQLSELPVSPQDPSPSGCWFTLAEGEFEIRTEDRAFYDILVYRHSCSWRILSTVSDTGHYEQVGDSLVFTRFIGTQSYSFPGIVKGKTLVAIRNDDTLYFKRR